MSALQKYLNDDYEDLSTSNCKITVDNCTNKALVRIDFLNTVLPQGGVYCVVGIKKGKAQQTFLNTLEEVDQWAEQQPLDNRDAYFSPASYNDRSGRFAKNAKGFRSLYIDLDIGKGTEFPTQHDGLVALKNFSGALQLPTPTIVSSGYGIHCYWTFTEAVDYNTWKPLAVALVQRIMSEGFKVKDKGLTTDAVRILRLPDTINFKNNSKADVKVIKVGAHATVQEYQRILNFGGEISPIDFSKAKKTQLNETSKALMGEFPECSFSILMDNSLKGMGCDQLAHIHNNQANVSYPLWMDALSIAQHCSDKKTAIHEISKNHPNYDPAKTEFKANECAKPHLCTTFNANNSGICENCSHFTKINTPIVLGRADASKKRLTTIEQTVKHKDTGYEEEMDIVVLLASGKVFDTSNISKELLNKARHRLSNLNGESGNGTRSFNFIEKDIVSLKTVHKQYSLLHIPEQPVVVVDTKTGSLLRMGELNLLLGDKCCLLGFDTTKYGPVPVYRDAFDVWKCARGKNKLTSIVMTKNPTKLYEWNLFKGYGVTATQGSCELIRQHIKEVICAGDDVVYEAFLNLLAWQFQQVGKPSRIIVAIRSTEQQIGKSLLTEYLEKMLGVSYFYSNDAANVFSKFNSQIRGKILVVLDEAVFAKDLKLAAIIKSTATAASIPSEEKFVKPILLPSGINILITTNEEHIAHIERSDARYWIITASPHKFGDTNYFLSVVDERDNGGAEAFLWFLLNRDVSNFIPSRDVPKNNAELDIAKALSAAPLSTADWLQHSIDSERLLGFFIDSNSEGFTEGTECMVWPENHKKVKAGRLYHAYTIWVNRTKAHRSCSSSTGRAFWDVLTAVGFTPDVNSNRTIPSITELKNNLATYLAGKNRVISE